MTTEAKDLREALLAATILKTRDEVVIACADEDAAQRLTDLLVEAAGPAPIANLRVNNMETTSRPRSPDTSPVVDVEIVQESYQHEPMLRIRRAGDVWEDRPIQRRPSP